MGTDTYHILMYDVEEIKIGACIAKLKLKQCSKPIGAKRYTEYIYQFMLIKLHQTPCCSLHSWNPQKFDLISLPPSQERDLRLRFPCRPCYGRFRRWRAFDIITIATLAFTGMPIIRMRDNVSCSYYWLANETVGGHVIKGRDFELKLSFVANAANEALEQDDAAGRFLHFS